MATPGLPDWAWNPAPAAPRLRFALAGCVRISTNHFAALEEHAVRADLVAGRGKRLGLAAGEARR